MAAWWSDSTIVYGGLSVESVAVALVIPAPEISGQLELVRLSCIPGGFFEMHAFLSLKNFRSVVLQHWAAHTPRGQTVH